MEGVGVEGEVEAGELYDALDDVLVVHCRQRARSMKPPDEYTGGASKQVGRQADGQVITG